MAIPITWRNVDAPDLSGVSRMMSQAQAGITSGFDRLQDILKTERATADANWGVIRDNNTQAFLDSINRYRTPEEYQAALNSGALDLGQYGAQIDRAAVRNALDGRLGVLQDRAVKEITYGNTMTDAKEDPLKRQVLADILLGKAKPEDMTQYQDKRFFPEVATQARNINRQNTEWANADTEFVRKGEKHESELLTDAARRQLLADQAAHSRAAASRENHEMSSSTTALKAKLAATKAQNAAAELLIKNSPLDSGTMDTFAGQKAFEEALGKLGLKPEQAKSVRENYAKQFGKGVLVGYGPDNEEIRIGLPVSTALAGVRGSSDDWYTPNFLNVSNQGSSAVKRVKELMADPSYVEALQKAMQAQGVRYRALSPADSDSTERTSVTSRTSRRSIFPSVADDNFSGAGITQQVIDARIAQAKSQMSPKEIEEARSGRISPRIMKILQGEDER